MLLTPLLLVGICFAEAASPFKVRERCTTRHLKNKYAAICNGDHEDFTLTARTTKHMVEADLTNFQSVTFDSSVLIERIVVSNTPRVSLSLNNPMLTDLKIDSVDELTLRYELPRDTGQRAKMTLTNIMTLRLISDGEFVWSIESLNLTDVKDVDLGSSLLKIITKNVTISNSNIRVNSKTSTVLSAASGSSLLKIIAKNVTISNSNIRVNSKTSTVLSAASAFIDKSSVFIYKKGSINVTVHQFTMKDTRVDLDGHISLIDSEVLFANSLLYGFDNQPLSIHGDSAVRFEGNSIFTHDVASILGLSKDNVIFKGNSFGCNKCYIKGFLLDADLQSVGDVNYCYSNCNLTLNGFKASLMEGCFCAEKETYMSHNLLCDPDIKCPNKSTNFYSLWRLLLTLILLLLITALVFCMCHINKRRKQKTKGLNNAPPQTFTYKREQTAAFQNNCYDYLEENHYETVEPLSYR